MWKYLWNLSHCSTIKIWKLRTAHHRSLRFYLFWVFGLCILVVRNFIFLNVGWTISCAFKPLPSHLSQFLLFLFPLVKLPILFFIHVIYTLIKFIDFLLDQYWFSLLYTFHKIDQERWFLLYSARKMLFALFMLLLGLEALALQENIEFPIASPSKVAAKLAEHYIRTIFTGAPSAESVRCELDRLPDVKVDQSLQNFLQNF